MEVTVRDTDGNEVKSGFVNEDESFSFVTAAGSSGYTILVTQNDYSDPNIYTLLIDLKRKNSHTASYVPTNGMWSGFAITNSGDSIAEDVTLTSCDDEGKPVHTLLGPFNMNPGERRMFTVDDLPIRLHEKKDTSGLKLMADDPVSLVNLFGSFGKSMSCFAGNKAESAHIILPDTVPPMTIKRNMRGAVANESQEEADISMRLYTSNGALFSERSVSLKPGEILPVKPGFYPFYSMPDSGWIDIIADYDQKISGYQYISSTGSAESLFALPVKNGTKIVPHIPPPGNWITTLTLINPNDVENPVTLHLKTAGADLSRDLNLILSPMEKIELELQDSFGKNSWEDYYHSIVEIDGEYPIAGCYTYTTGQDEVTLSLLGADDFQKELVLPHCAAKSSGQWWTGVGIFNPFSSLVTVEVRPYDLDGNLIAQGIKNINLDSGKYEIFSAGSYFGEKGSRISFIKFNVTGTGYIGGFYLYGNRDNTMLSGANM